MNKFYLPVIASLISLQSFAQWNEDPAVNNLVCTQAQDQQDVKMVTDSKGGAIIAWVDFRNDANSVSADIFVQRISANGTNKWTANGVAICTNSADQTAPVITEDGKGGAIIAWQDWRNGNRDIYVQRIDSSGNIQWMADGLGVVVKNSHQASPRIVSDDAEGAVIVWEDSINGNWDIYAQHINENGVPDWTSGGVAVCTSTQSQINPRIATRDFQNYYIIWQDRRNGNDYDIYLQKLNSAGVVQLSGNGEVVCNATNSQTNPKIAMDYSGGAIIVWQHYVTGNGYDVYAQRMVSGTPQWTANGIAVCSTIGNQSAIDITTEHFSGGAIVCWKDARNANVNIYAQKLTSGGEGVWTSNGVLVSDATRNQINPNIVGDGNSGAIIVWQDSIAGIWDVYAQRISSSGVPVWTAGGIAVGIASDNQTGPKNVSDGDGGSVFAFQDKRSGDFDIYAYRLTANGSVTAVEQMQETQSIISVFPNPFTESTTVYLPEGKHNIRIFDLTGREVMVALSANTNSYIFQKGTLSDGTYLLTVNSENTTYSKLIIIQ